MWKVEPPHHTAAEVVHLCARGVRNAGFRRRTDESADVLQENSSAYQLEASRSACHTLVSTTTLQSPAVTAGEMKKLYSGQMARPNSPASAAYDRIMGKAPNGLCSYCQYGVATTLDHFVPKTTVPTLSIEPWNLIPSCKDCNHRMGSTFSESGEDEFLHPYFMPHVGRWLRSSIERSYPVVAIFYADPSPDVGQGIRHRILKQFDALGLADLYSVVASGELIEIGAAVTDIWESSSPDSVRAHLVRAHLTEMAEKAAALSMNSRRSALYEGLAADDWYCSGGFLEP